MISHSSLQAQLPEHQATVLCLDELANDIAQLAATDPEPRCGALDLAYVIYTSGSTGNPKGVMLQHQGACNLIAAQARVFGLGASDRMLQFASMSFDASIFEIVMGLGVGAQLVLGSKDELAPGLPLLSLLQEHKVTAVTLPPSALMQLPETGLPELRVITVAGEACPQELVDRWQPGRRFFNLYGPTEATVWATFEECIPGRVPTIGKAVPNASVHILNEQLQPVPAGVAGELCLGGAGLARGYMNREELTAEKFIQHPVDPALRIYRTGDLVRFNDNGDLEFLGRIDHQVKVRGFRIELGEIEAALAANVSVQECVVLAHGQGLGDKQLVAYLTPEGEAPTLSELRAWLQQSLPDYMVPASFVVLDEFPLTPNGKIDRKALPDPDATKLGVSSEYAAPTNREEKILAGIWAELLGTDKVGIHDNFFELGGDSILSIQIIARASQQGLRLTAKQLFQNQTIAELAAAMTEGSVPVKAEQGRVLGDVQLTPIQQWFLDKQMAEVNHFNQSMRVKSDEALDPIILEQALHLLTDHHDALRMRYTLEGGHWLQTIAPFEDSQLLVELRTETDNHLNRLQGRLNIGKGPLLKAALFDEKELVITVHHLAVDWVSWPVILADLELAYRQLSRTRPVSFPLKTTSFKEWSERLHQYACSDEMQDELKYWQQRPWKAATRLPVDKPDGGNLEAHGKLRTVSLDEAQTKELLQTLTKQFSANANDILLTAVAGALAEWSDNNTVMIDLEGHGREELFDDVDISRTVGWFTSLYPALLEVPATGSIASAFHAVKSQLAELPSRGIGYGLLRYLRADSELSQELPQADISFNYLGQIDQASSGDSLFRSADGARGIERSLNNERMHNLDINSMVSDGRLYLNIGYSTERYDEDTIVKLADSIEAKLVALTSMQEDLESSDAIEAARFPLSGLDQNAVETLLAGKPAVEDIYPLTPLQQGMLFHSLLERDSDVYFASFNWLLEGDIDTDLFNDAWNRVINQHSSLRSACSWEGITDPVQIVYREVAVPFALEDWREYNSAEQDSRLGSWLDQDRSRTFDLGAAPLTRVTLIRLGDNSYRMIWSFHHMIMDGWSVPLVIREVFSAYEALSNNEAPVLTETRPFRDYIEWLLQQDQNAAQDFWRDKLAGFRAPTPLPAASAATLSNVPDYHEAVYTLPADAGAALKIFAQQRRLTVNSITQGAWALLLSRYSGEDDVVFGATTAGRPATLAGIETMIGLFLNTLPVRIGVQNDLSLNDWLQTIQEQQLDIQQYEFASLVDIQGWSDVPRGQPLFETLLAFENYPDIETMGNDAGSIKIKSSQGFDRTNFPLTMNIAMMDTLYLRFIYDRNLFSDKQIERLGEHLLTLLQNVPAYVDKPVADLPMLASGELQQLDSWNDTAVDYPEATLVSMLADQAAKTPQAQALSFDGNRLSYAEVGRLSDQLANYLVAQGVQRGSLVGVCMERSVEMVLSLLAIVKAGGAYVPMDPEYPEQRLRHMAEDAELELMLSQSHLSEVLANTSIERINIDAISDALNSTSDSAPDVTVGPADAAYVIFTSGSTGRPKGVLNEHGGIVNRLQWMQSEYQLDANDRVLQKTPFSFDVSVWEFFWPLITGAELVIAKPGGHRDSSYLAGLIKTEQITTLHFVPSMLQVFLQDEASKGCTTLKRVICSGEALPYDLQQRFFASMETAELHNLYGPTEAAIDVSYWACQRDSAERSVPIGRPVANTKLYVVDESGKQTPLGVPGELWISGIQVARGYVNRPELTAERFIADPFNPGARVYRTGDLVRYREDGAIEFLGRIDHQVKLRGFRIELGEIEAVLTDTIDVDQATVLLREDVPGLQQLVAYLVMTDGSAFDPEQIAANAAATLTDYMVPTAWVQLDEMPLSPNGKIDRKALPAPEVDVQTVEYIAPRNDLESGLAEIWQDLLAVEKIGINDDFFALGGHSLVAMRVVTCARDQLNVNIALDALFTAPTIAKLAETAAKTVDGVTDSNAATDGQSEASSTIKRVDRSSRARRKRPKKKD